MLFDAEDFNEAIARMNEAVGRAFAFSPYKLSPEILAELDRQRNEERWRSDPLGLMWIFEAINIRYLVADGLRAIANLIDPE